MVIHPIHLYYFFFFQAEDGIRDADVTGVQTCALPILRFLCQAVFPTPAKVFRRCRRYQNAGNIPSIKSTRNVYDLRSEERRVGKECRSRWWRYDLKKNMKDEAWL